MALDDPDLFRECYKTDPEECIAKYERDQIELAEIRQRIQNGDLVIRAHLVHD